MTEKTVAEQYSEASTKRLKEGLDRLQEVDYKELHIPAQIDRNWRQIQEISRNLNFIVKDIEKIKKILAMKEENND